MKHSNTKDHQKTSGTPNTYVCTTLEHTDNLQHAQGVADLVPVVDCYTNSLRSGLQAHPNPQSGGLLVPAQECIGTAVLEYIGKGSTEQSQMTRFYALQAVARRLGVKMEDLENLTPNQARALRSSLVIDLEDGVIAFSTINKYFAVLTGILVRVYLRGDLEALELSHLRDILDGVKGESGLTGRYVYNEELEQVFEFLTREQTPANVRNLVLISLLYHGLRREEVRKVRLDDIVESGTVVRVRGKAHRERNVPLEKSTQYFLKTWMSLRGSVGEFLLCAIRKGGVILPERQLSNMAIHRTLETIVNEAGVDKFTAHDLRRKCISDLLEAGVDLITVQKIVGHASPEMTSRYDRRPELLRAQKIQLLAIPERKFEDLE